MAWQPDRSWHDRRLRRGATARSTAGTPASTAGSSPASRRPASTAGRPARRITPKRANVRFLPSAAAAQRDGFRACLRCRPDAAPGSPDWNYRADVVGRAMRLIADGVVDRDGVPGLAARLGYTERHLGRLLHRRGRRRTARPGPGPARPDGPDAHRDDRARAWPRSRSRPASAACASSTTRSARSTAARRPSCARPGAAAGRRPSWARSRCGCPTASRCTPSALLEFLGRAHDRRRRRGARRRVPARRCACRTARARSSSRSCPGYVQATLRLADVRDLAPAVARCRRLLDLDADPVAVDAVLAARPGPGAERGQGARGTGPRRRRRVRDGGPRRGRPADLGGRRPHGPGPPRRPA